jgi:hypothetical protein
MRRLSDAAPASLADAASMTNDANPQIPEPARRSHRLAARVAALAGLAGATLIVAADAAHAGVQINHNESPARDRRSPVTRAALALSTAVATAGPLLVLAASAADARIAVNHIERAGRDRRRHGVRRRFPSGSLALIGGVVAASSIALTPAAASATEPRQRPITVVVPTGAYPADVEAVQAAVDLGGTVVLSDVDAAGVPTAFDFGPPDGDGVVRLTVDVDIVGDRGLQPARVVGGPFPFFGVERSRTRIEGVTFDAPGLSAAIFVRSTGVEFVGNRVTGVVGIELTHPFPVVEGRGVKFLGNDDPEGAITGRVVVADNQFDNMHAELSHAIVLDQVAADVSIVGNRVEDVAGGGVAAYGVDGSFEIARNTIFPGPGTSSWHVGNGIDVWGGRDLRIEHNVIRADNPMADGILVGGIAGEQVGTVDGAVIRHNRITMATQYGAISLWGDVDRSVVADNRMVGAGAYAIGLLPLIGDEVASANRIQGNSARAFVPTVAHWVVGAHAVDTIVAGNGGIVHDEGRDTVVTGGGRGRGAIDRMSANLERVLAQLELAGIEQP